jgi:hypothetical protein
MLNPAETLFLSKLSDQMAPNLKRQTFKEFFAHPCPETLMQFRMHTNNEDEFL